jgi:hypothetical protein
MKINQQNINYENKLRTSKIYSKMPKNGQKHTVINANVVRCKDIMAVLILLFSEM